MKTSRGGTLLAKGTAIAKASRQEQAFFGQQRKELEWLE